VLRRKISGKYAMIARQDNENLHLIYSDHLNRWDGGHAILKPEPSAIHNGWKVQGPLTQADYRKAGSPEIRLWGPISHLRLPARFRTLLSHCRNRVM